MTGSTPKPTIGRIVHMRPVDRDACLAAIVAFVYPDETTINAMVIDGMGRPQDCDTLPQGDGPAEWHWPERED